MPIPRRLLSRERKLKQSGYQLIAGIDEAGRGPLAGPVVASAVILRRYRFTARIDDSKKLSARQRARAYSEIIANATIGVGIVDEKMIDAINIHRATKKAMELALANLSIPPEYVLLDGTMKIQTLCPAETIIGGDAKSISIAAASIVAKVTRDTIMDEYHAQYPQYGFSRHKGYATKAHKEALRANGPSPIHRRSFAPVRDCPLPD